MKNFKKMARTYQEGWNLAVLQLKKIENGNTQSVYIRPAEKTDWQKLLRSNQC